MQTLSTNPQLELAYDYVQWTNKNIFLTGKAGTGKTTFLHRIKEECIKRMVVVAPTGVAAINAKGMTIHSFFQVPFGPFLPGEKTSAERQRKFSRKKIRLIKSLDLLIIDEISMVRADLLDSIDEVLRRYKNPLEPFGGVQLLMIGDLHQLPPVVKPQDWHMLQKYYQTAYFFGSLALQQTNPITIQLQHIYRQSDDVFIDLLNKVRDNQLTPQVLEQLNSRYVPNFKPTEEEPYITLTSHNSTAYKINQEKLKELPAQLHTFKAKVEGIFPEHAFPTNEILEFKVGAQVLFIKNDISFEKLYFNGKIGKITNINSDGIHVKCPGDDGTIVVNPVEWENVKYTLNEGSKEVEEELLGKFTQYPLKLAWAITIHKSQGLTFERAIIDAQAAFAHGQVYVALSRCKSFEGIVLRSRIIHSSVKTDSVVKDYSIEAEKNAPDENQLEEAKKEFQQTLIYELFSFKHIQRATQRVHKIYFENAHTLTNAAVEQFKTWTANASNDLFSMGKKFEPHLNNYFRDNVLPETNEDLQNRIKKASVYFLEKLEKQYIPEIRKMPIATDNQKVRKQATESLENLIKALFIKKSCFKMAQEEFSSAAYLKIKANADLDFDKQKTSSNSGFGTSSTRINIPNDVPHPKLYTLLSKWRESISKELDISPHEVIPLPSISELTKFLPTSSKTLLQIKGIGKAKVSQFGDDLIDMIESFCTHHGIATNLITSANPPAAADSKTESFNLYKSGKTISEIAKMRGLTEGTIEGHLAHFVKEGKIEITELVSPEKIEIIKAFLEKHKGLSLGETRKQLGNKYSYAVLRMVNNFLKRKN